MPCTHRIHWERVAPDVVRDSNGAAFKLLDTDGRIAGAEYHPKAGAPFKVCADCLEAEAGKAVK